MKNLSDFIIDYTLIKRFDINALRENIFLPILEDDVYTLCAVCKESNVTFAKECFFNLVQYIEVSKAEIFFYLSSFEQRTNLFDLSLKAMDNFEENHKYIDEFLSSFLFFSSLKRASDIHLETDEEQLNIRFRVDGKLKHFFSFHKRFYKMISSFIKLQCNLDITQYRKPLDGRMSYIFENQKYDFRVSIMPTILGESIVIRILDNKGVEKKLSSLEFSKDIQNNLASIKNLTQGLVLICGPTGSGKTTTLYSLIKDMDLQSKKIITVEDPVEYKIKGVQQINVNEKIDLDFTTVLKNILRQDPDVIFIGEIRDANSLNIAIQASLTGHLVLSTIHSSSALNSISRLLELKAESFLLSTTLKAIFYQRLVLKVCKYCQFVGCEKCNYTKYLGRTAIAESLKINEELSTLLASEKSIETIKTNLKVYNFKTILDDGKEKVKKGVTSLDEVYKVLGFDSEI